MSAFKFAGTVSEGTLRPEDLIPKFMSVLDDLKEDLSLSGTAEDREAFKDTYGKLDDELGSLEQDMQADDYWDDEEAVQEDLDWLIETLNELAPEGYYFGAHPGDGADFGFWEVEDGGNDDDEDED